MIKKENVNESNVPEMVPYVVYRDAITDNRVIVVRLVWVIILCLLLLFGSNLAWLLVWNNYEFATTETYVESEDTGIANYTGGNGGIMLGADYSTADQTNETDGLSWNANPN